MTMPLLFALETAHFVFGMALFFTAVFLILLVLVQRGRGGGLSGALGGAGGQSAFGAKAGDTFTRITVIVAGVWIMLCAASIIVLQDSGGSNFKNISGASPAGTNIGGGGDPDKPADNNSTDEGGAAETP